MKDFKSLLETIRTLRAPGGCPWDRAQKISDMKKYLLEEVYELIDAIDSKDSSAAREELGDIFLILTTIAEMFRQKGDFELKDVFQKTNDKLITRHPHVFSSKKLKTKKDVLKHWIKDKAKQKKRKAISDRLPATAPSLLLANIFLKECAHSQSHDSRRGYKKLLLDLNGKINKLKKKKPSKELLTAMIMDISQIAFDGGVDLEIETRKAVFKRAKRARYKA